MGLSWECGVAECGKEHFVQCTPPRAKRKPPNYPFCTIDPGVGVVTVPDDRLEKISQFVKPQNQVPTVMEFVDIAGIVAGAGASSEGLGNKFLSNIRETDAISRVVRCFVDPNVVHVSGSVDPLRDIDVINTELMLADLDSVEKRYKKIEKDGAKLERRQSALGI